MKDSEIRGNLKALLRAFIQVAQADGFGRYRSFETLFDDLDDIVS